MVKFIGLGFVLISIESLKGVETIGSKKTKFKRSK